MRFTSAEIESYWHHEWRPDGVAVALIAGGGRLTRDKWAAIRPASARVAEALGMHELASELILPTKAFAVLSDYDAHQLGLPLHMEAWVHLHLEGRIDSPHFRLTMALEPLQYSHPWAVYRRDGARIMVGERRYRLNPHQLEVMELFDELTALGPDIAARIALYPRLVRALRAPRYARLRASGNLGHITVQRLQDAGDRLLFTRENGRLLPFDMAPATGWAMTAKHHYYVSSD